MPRPTWKGNISFGLVNIPIVLYPGEKRSELHFHMIDSRNRARIRYQRVNEVTGEEVPMSEIVKGYEYDDGNYVLLSDEDFEQASPEATKTVQIEDFVELDSIPKAYFEKPYFLAPGKGGEKGYVLLREALQRTGRVGIARVVIRTKEYLSAVIPQGNTLVLEILRYQHELRNPEELNLPEGDTKKFKISAKELELAEMLIDSMKAEWEPGKYKDEYSRVLMEWIEKKIRAGNTEALPEREEEASESEGKVIDMMALLKRSLEKRGLRGSKEAAGKSAGGSSQKARGMKKAG
jgi:DNA end-binding protein Ku